MVSPGRILQPRSHSVATASRACARAGDASFFVGSTTARFHMRGSSIRLTSSSIQGRRWLIALGMSFLLAAPVAAEPAKEEVRSQCDQFRSAGKVIAVERFEPATPGKYPAI